MMLGHLVLGVEALPFFYSGLVLLACGSGLLKPNVSTLVGNLYRDRPELRDQGFNIFYMGINIGAFVVAADGGVAARALRLERRRSCRPRVAMLLSLVVFIDVQTLRRRRRREGRRRRRAASRRAQRRARRARASSRCSPCSCISSVFWIAFYQIFYTFTFWARDNTATTIAPETFQVVRTARRHPAFAGAGRRSGCGCSAATPSRRRP